MYNIIKTIPASFSAFIAAGDYTEYLALYYIPLAILIGILLIGATIGLVLGLIARNNKKFGEKIGNVLRKL